LLTPQAKQEVVLTEAEPFNCVRCGKPFARADGGQHARKLSGHSMFAGDGSLNGCRCGGLPRGGHDGQQERNDHPDVKK